MQYIVVDLEATCWERRSGVEEMEIIEIGAVRLDESSFEVTDEFAKFVRPVLNPVLSGFCTSLTSIRQKQVDQAARFPGVYSDFLSWIGDSRFRLMSWGRYDWRQLEADCEKHAIGFPPAGCDGHVNLKEPFS
ncbi:MAG: 3'-5' exonuclease, partial [Pseudomonadota bacterium]